MSDITSNGWRPLSNPTVTYWQNISVSCVQYMELNVGCERGQKYWNNLLGVEGLPQFRSHLGVTPGKI